MYCIMSSLQESKTLQGTTIQQMWQILRAHEIRLNDISDYLKEQSKLYNADSSDLENEGDLDEKTLVRKHVSTLNGSKKTRGKNVTLDIVEEN